MAGKKGKVRAEWYTKEHMPIMHLEIGLGRQSQGMSTALAVEKTSKRGGKIINVAAERGEVYSVTQGSFAI